MNRIIEQNRTPLYPALPLSTPWVINVDPSSICNFKCKFCFHSDNDKMIKKGIMPFNLYKKVISDIKQFDAPLKTLRLYAFGEPLLNHHFCEMIQYAKDANVAESIDTTTNGSMLNPKYNLKIIESGLDRINISVEGISSQQYKEFSHYSLNFDSFVENIAHLYQNKKQCTVFIKINGDVISKDDQQKFLEIFTSISDGIAIENIMNCWYGIDIEANNELGIYGQTLKEVQVCPYIAYSYCVNYNGTVSACFLDWNQRLLIGSIFSSSLKEIWNGPDLRLMRRMIFGKLRDKMPICCDCNQLVAGQPEDLDQYAEELLEKYL